MAISKEQFKKLCEELLSETPAILKNRDPSNKKMDKESVLLKSLYEKVQEKLSLSPKPIPSSTDFPTFAFAYRTVLYELINRNAKEPFEYRPIVEDFLNKSLKKK